MREPRRRISSIHLAWKRGTLPVPRIGIQPSRKITTIPIASTNMIRKWGMSRMKRTALPNQGMPHQRLSVRASVAVS
jgi:hypothetical protein